MPRSESASARLLTLVALVVTVAGLYFGREVLIPLALAILFSFLLAPLVNRLERLGVWRVPAVLLVTVAAFVVVVLLGYILAGQIVELADRLPEYSDAIKQRAASIRHSAGGILSRASRNILDISKELATQAATQPAAPAAAAERVAATPVRVVEGPSSAFDIAMSAVGSVLHPVLTAGLVIIFVIFILVQREDLRDRLIRLAGKERVDLTTQVLDDAAQRISRYLLMQATTNTTFGLLTALGLYLLGMPNAFLWGLLMGALRFVPYIGIWIGMAIPVALSLAVWPEGWGRPLAVVGVVVGLEMITANVAEPLLYGSGTGISPLAVLMAAVFWGWLWGPVGLLLSTPLTVCLAVMGKYVPVLGFLEVLLSDEPVLDPPVRFYQRLLANDQEEAQELAETLLEDTSLVAVYDRVLIPGLHLAEMDRHRGRLDKVRTRAVSDGMQTTIDQLIARDRELGHERKQIQEPETTVQQATNGSGQPSDAAGKTLQGIQVLGLPACDQADQVVAMMLAQVLTRNGVQARSVPANMLVSEMLDAVEGSGARIVCVSAMPPDAMTKARHLCKRLKDRFPAIKVVVGLWNAGGDVARARDRLLTAGADHVVTDLAAALQLVQPSLGTRTVPTA